MSLYLYGLPASSLTWTVRILLHEKQLPYDMGLADCDSIFTMRQSPDIDLHPYRKVPILDHDGRKIWETPAICRYLDTVFDGPHFTPEDPYSAAQNDQWVSAISAYVDRAVIRKLVLPPIIARMTSTEPDPDAQKTAVTLTEKSLRPLETILDGNRYILGDQPVLADFFLWPILFYMKRLPAGARILLGFPNLQAALETATARRSFQETLPR